MFICNENHSTVIQKHQITILVDLFLFCMSCVYMQVYIHRTSFLEQTWICRTVVWIEILFELNVHTNWPFWKNTLSVYSLPWHLATKHGFKMHWQLSFGQECDTFSGVYGYSRNAPFVWGVDFQLHLTQDSKNTVFMGITYLKY